MISFSLLRKLSSCLLICATFFPGTLGSKPGLQIFIAGGTHAGLTLGITAAFTFLFLLGHHGLGQIVAVLFSQNAADLAVLPEEAHAAGLRFFRIVPDPVDQNGVVSRYFSHHDILHGLPCININKTLERCQRSALKQTLSSDIYRSFPAQKAGAKTVVVLKNPKTDESKRYVYINDILLGVLNSLKEQQAYFKELLGPDYHDYRLIFSLENGDPMTSGVMSKRFHRFCKKHGLKNVDMYSLRHSGCMAKLIAANGNLKAVQGVMGHSTSQMVLKIYSEIRDEDRKRMAEEMARRMQEQLITK